MEGRWVEKNGQNDEKDYDDVWALHPKSDIDQLYLKWKHGGRGLISIEMCLRSEENNLGLHVRGSNEILLKGVKKVSIVKTENLM